MEPKKINLLLIEDDPDDVLLIKEMLAEGSGDRFLFNVIHAGRLSEGIAKAGHSGIDIILSDMGLPDSQGLETFRALFMHFEALPIVVLTGLSDEQIGIQSLKEGAQDYLAKGEVNSRLLVRSISYALERRHILHELQVHQQELNMQNEELRRSEEELEASRARYYDLYDLAPVGYFMISEKGLILEANLTAAALLGVLRSELINMPLTRFIFLEDQDIYYLHRTQLFEIDSPQACELRLARKDAAPFWARVEASVVNSIDGSSVCRAVISDITLRRQSEEEAASLKKQIEYILGATKTGLDIIDEEFNIAYIDPEWQKICGDPAGLKCFQYFMEREAPCEGCGLVKAFQTKSVTVCEQFLVKENNRPVQVTTIPFKNTSGKWLVAEVNADISRIKQAEAELVRLATAIEQSDETIVITDTEGRILYANPSFERITGYAPAEALGQNPRLLKSGMQDGAFYGTLWETISGGNVWKGHFVNKKKDGTLYDEEATISPIKNAGGSIINYVAVKRDVTKELLMEKHLQQSQKMEAIGTLAGGIAHDFNNILAAITGYTEIAYDNVQADTDVKDSLAQVLKAAERAKDLVKQILAFSRKSGQERKPLQMHFIVQDALNLLRASLPATIEIRLDITKRNDTLNADPTQIHQVIMNLCTNASHAMQEKGGVLSVGLAPFDVTAGDALQFPDVQPGPYVKLTVSDTGTGIDPNIIKRIFDPFFTTKEKGKGTGMGLSVVHGIVKSHGGTIIAASDPGKGSTFIVLLPRICADKQEKSPEEEKPVPRGTESVLFLDDELSLVQSCKKILESLGYRVTALQSSTEALEVFQRSPAAFDLVITDQTMPHMTGYDLVPQLLKIRKDIPVILCTGYSEKVSEEKARAIGVRGYILKPIRKREMAEAIRRVLDD